MNQHTHSRSPWRLRHALCGLFTGLLLLTVDSGCDSSAALQRTLTQKTIAYEIHPTEYNLTDLAHSYGELLEAQLGDTIYPGCFAEYGVALALLGKNSEANRMFNNEVFFYPNSARYVRQLKLQLVPEYISDTVSDTSTIYVIELEPEEVIEEKPMTAKDSIQQAKALQRQQREEAKRQQAEAKKAQAEERDLIKSIRAKEKEQRDLERANAKEAKEQAKKEAARQKKEAAKQREREKEEAAKAKAEQRAREKEARRHQQESDDE